jgi:hypothetical protein
MFAQGCGGDVNVHPGWRFRGSEAGGRRLGRPLRRLPAGRACRGTSTQVIYKKWNCLGEDHPNMAGQPWPRPRAAALEKRGRLLPSRTSTRLVLWAERWLPAAHANRLNTQPAFRVQGHTLGKASCSAYRTKSSLAGLPCRTISLPHALVFGYTNGCIDYIPTAKAYPGRLRGCWGRSSWPAPAPAECEQIVQKRRWKC